MQAIQQGIISLYDFLVIQNFGALMTLIAGLVALKIYNTQKRDEKVNAARIILAEIRNAERRVEEVSALLQQKLGVVSADDFPSVLPTNSWREYSYLFASDFDQDELESLNNFYNISENIDDLVHKDNNFFWSNVEHRSASVQNKLADLIQQSLVKSKNQIDDTKLSKLLSSVLNKLSDHYYFYAPKRTLIGLQKSIEKFDKITTTSVGIKLKGLTIPRRHLL